MIITHVVPVHVFLIELLVNLFSYADTNMLLQALLDYERHKTKGGELTVPIASHSEPINIENQVLCELL